MNLVHQKKFFFLARCWKMKPTAKNEDVLIPIAGGEVNGFLNQTGMKILDANDS